MQRLEVSGAVRLIYRLLGVKGLKSVLTVLSYANENWIKLAHDRV